MASYVTNWNGPAISATLGVVLSAIGVAVTIAAGFLDRTLVQDYHIGVHLIPEQDLAEPAVQHRGRRPDKGVTWPSQSHGRPSRMMGRT